MGLLCSMERWTLRRRSAMRSPPLRWTGTCTQSSLSMARTLTICGQTFPNPDQKIILRAHPYPCGGQIGMKMAILWWVSVIFSSSFRWKKNVLQENSSCNALKGTDGAQFPPGVKKSDTLWIFNTLPCRSLFFNFQEKVKIEGKKTMVWKIFKEIFYFKESPL